MSLIYDALTDLENREATQASSKEFSNHTDEPAKKLNRKPYKFLVFFGAVFSCYVAISSFQIVLNAHTPSGAVFPEGEMGPRYKQTGELDKISIQEVPGASVSQEEVMVAQISASHNASIDTLLAKAEAAFHRQRYSVPESDNAARYYNEVLEMEPANERALAGLLNVADAYVRLFEDALANGNEGRASLMRQRLIDVIGFGETSSYETMLTEIENKYQTPQRLHQRIQQVEDSPKALTVSIQKSKKQIQAELLKNIRNLILSGKNDVAKELINQEIRKGDLRLASLEPLVKTFIDRGKHSQAIGLLNAIPEGETEFTYLYAIAVQAELGDEETLSFLRSRYDYDEQAAAMYAGLLQKHEDYALAADIYEELARHNTNNALYWLGLAVSLENLGQSISAQSAYKRSLALGGHSLSISRFIQRRIELIASASSSLELSQW